MKEDRQKEILRLIRENSIGTQEELAKALNQSGLKVTQATISRDIRELRLTKTGDGHGGQRYVEYQVNEPHLNDKYVRVLKEGFSSMDSAGNLLVIRTASGMAMAVGAAIDGLHFPEIIGSIAGDDTIMCAVHTPEGVSRLMKKIRAILEK
ncbi:MAG: arginine repressor [Lachnospiraceae bacterium]|jgi:transcriptional regulator of arginine metabolism